MERTTTFRRSLIVRILFSSLLAVIPSLGEATKPLEAFTAVYQLTSGSMTVGEMSLSLSFPAPGVYHYQAKSHPTGLIGRMVGGRIEERSQGDLEATLLRPVRYHYRREGRKARVVSLQFDWDRMRVVNTINDDPWTMAIEPDTVDKLAVQLALMRDLGVGKSAMDYRVADGGTLKSYRFERVGEETIESPVGPLQAVRVRRDRGRSNRHTDFWCAEKLHYLPVLMVQYRDGKEHARMTLQTFESMPTDR